MLAVHVSTSVLRVLFLRVRSIQSILICASTAVVAQVFVLQRQFTRVNCCVNNFKGHLKKRPFFMYIDNMKTILHVLVKSAIIVAVAVVCYYIYMAVIGK